jgi:hypothetical protein
MTINRVLAALIFLSTATFLFAARLGSPWAGGGGVVTPLEASVVAVEGEVLVDRAGNVRSAVVGEFLTRGESLRTDEGGRLVIRVARDAYLALDERGSLVLDRLEPSQISVHLVAGRMLGVAGAVAERLRVTTNHTNAWIVEDALSVVNYDFLETISVVPFHTAVSAIVEPDQAFVTSRAINVHETEPVSIVDAAFNASVIPFYAWAEQQTGYDVSQ